MQTIQCIQQEPQSRKKDEIWDWKWGREREREPKKRERKRNRDLATVRLPSNDLGFFSSLGCRYVYMWFVPCFWLCPIFSVEIEHRKPFSDNIRYRLSICVYLRKNGRRVNENDKCDDNILYFTRITFEITHTMKIDVL